MTTFSNIKKEITCKPLSSIFDFAKNKGIEIKNILVGVPYDLSHLLNKHERIEWWVWCKIISNLRPYLTYSDYEQMGRDFQKKMHYIEGYIFAFLFFSSSKISKIIRGPLFKAENRILEPFFSCFNNDWEVVGENKYKMCIYLKPGYEQCPEWFYMSKGLWEEIGDRIRVKGLKIDLSIVPNGGIYMVAWDKERFFTGLKKQILWLFNIRKAFDDLTESNEELSNNYNKLEESKKLLQKQTTQLTTAYNITKSIKQSLDISKTLKAITYALVNDAGLSSARIKIFKDIEENPFETEASNGIAEENATLIIRPIVIDDKKIGELTICSKINTDISDLDELLNYLLPIINISIHDSLVLRTITDYKNNLEEKVDKRTDELTKAKDELSKTIQLLQDTQQVQNHFFTNISHEFRTPLTLILGPAKKILERTKDFETKEDATTIHRSALKLNMLANQLLDLSRIEAGKMKLKTREQNLVPIIKEIVSSFQSFAESRHLNLIFNSEKEEISVYLDKDIIDKIMSNLISNAIKFTPKYGEIKITISLPKLKSSHEKGKLKSKADLLYERRKAGHDKFQNDTFIEISVSDSGIGIPKEQIDKIFDRFFQVDNRLSREYEGTGIGLSLTRELIELHKGKISVISREGKGSTFSIFLPLGKEHLQDDEISDEIFISENNLKTVEKFSQKSGENIFVPSQISNKSGIEPMLKKNRYLLLIIEDNEEVRKYINDILNNYYKIAEASNGEEGLKKSFEHIPDLIISDIMMPGMDGFQLCNKLKADQRTSHIPIILLTAKSTLQDKIEGLEKGADDYIMKPFEAEELKVRIKNLLEQRKRIHEHFQKYGLFELNENQVTPLDQKFLQKVCEIINKQLSGSSFGVEALAKDMLMSRSLLHKKLVALTGEPPVELIKRFRLNKAAKIIERNSGNITEVAFEVGFTDSSYFTKCFKKQFGISPSLYHKEHIGN